MKNIIIGQSGGPTAVINSSIAGAYKKAKELGVEKVYGMVYGIEGFLQENFIDLGEYLENEKNYELLKRTPSAFLGSCRYKLPKIEEAEDVYEKIFSILEKYEIDALFYAGGNDSMDTIKMLSDYAKDNNKDVLFIGIPKTIDNDLPITDHCPGYGSCAKYIATSLKEIIRDNESFNKSRLTVCIVEIMGRHAGWLTASAALAKDDTCPGVDAIYLPEVAFNIDNFIEEVEELLKKKPNIVIAVSEGIRTEDRRFVCELLDTNLQTDSFGHKELVGCADALGRILRDRLGIKARPITLSTLQRAAAHLASKTDLEEAIECGKLGAELAYRGESGKMVIMTRLPGKTYKIKYDVFDDIHKIANIEKKIPLDWIDLKNNYVKQELIDYMRPLIMGEVKQIYKNGLPQHITMKK